MSLHEAFIEFWQATYSVMTEPADRWPAQIQNCLRCTSNPHKIADNDSDLMQHDSYDADISLDSPDVSLDDLFESEEEDHSDSDEEEEIQPERPPLFDFSRKSQSAKVEDKQKSPLVEHFGLPQVTPTSPGGAEEIKAISDTKATISLELFQVLEPPSTPTRNTDELSCISTPPRPRKPSSTFPSFFLRSPASPESTSRRITTTPKRSPMASGSSSKRMRLENKENLSPQSRVSIASVAERIATKSSPGLWPSVPGKRSISGEEEENSPKKRRRGLDLLAVSPEATAFINSETLTKPALVNATKIPQLLSLPADPDEDVFTSKADGVIIQKGSIYVLPSPSKKRKGVFMDFVEIPTLRQVWPRQRRAVSFDTPLPSTSTRGLRLAKSAMEPPKSMSPLEVPGCDHVGKRRRRQNIDRDANLVEDPFLTASQENTIPGSGKHIICVMWFNSFVYVSPQMIQSYLPKNHLAMRQLSSCRMMIRMRDRLHLTTSSPPPFVELRYQTLIPRATIPSCRVALHAKSRLDDWNDHVSHRTLPCHDLKN